MRLGKVAAVLGVAALIGVFGMAGEPVNAAPAGSASQATGSLIQQLQAAQNKVLKAANNASNLVSQIDDTQAAIDQAQSKISAYQSQITKANAEVKSRKTVLKHQLVSLQKQIGDSATGNVYFDFMLNAKDLSDLISRGFTVNKLNQASQEALQAVQDAQAKAKDLKAEQTAKKAELIANKSKLTAAKAAFDATAAKAKADAAALQKKIDDNKAQLTQLATSKNQATAKAAAAIVADNASRPQAAPRPVALAHQVAASTAVAPSLHGGSLVGNALGMRGVPYAYGGKSASGVDCSGLVYVAGRAAGIPALSSYHTSQALSTMGRSVSLGSLQPGDLLFWGGVGSAYHVAIYVGGGQYVHAPKPGDVVHTASVNGWRPNFARRV
ncbi:NlpC/P60 family protein [Lacticaseibacillus jixianensis]|uniref:NlpC/P60 family protein n=1 Tax=Lacticaseibacillus jixianensis TaxID=2486012 RepID=A0ABW4B7H0_9LACO|nr:C40 family peptidase [Lacticaseibacillus jixianensis]